MEFTVFHIENKPIDAEHRKLAKKEWQEFTKEVLKEKPETGDYDGWGKINDLLNVKEDELREKYPCKAIWTFSNLEEMLLKVKELGSISICDENGNYTLYIMSKDE